MSAIDFHLHESATITRPCPECGVIVTVAAPEKNGHGADQVAWKHWARLLRQQVCWPLLCPSCKQWWNDRVGERRETSPRRAA